MLGFCCGGRLPRWRGGLVVRLLLLCVVVLAGVLCVSAGSASAASEPWWYVGQQAVPTHIDPARQRDEVQQVTATPSTEEGEPLVAELAVKGRVVGCLAHGFFGVIICGGLSEEAENKGEQGFPTIETAAELQSALTGVYGSEVKVSGGPVGSGGPFVVTTLPGTAASSPLEVSSVLAGEAEARVTTEGVPAGEVVLRVTDVGDGPIEGASKPATVADALPAGLQATHISGTVHGWFPKPLGGGVTQGSHGSVVCSLSGLSCTLSEDELTGNSIEVGITVVASPGAQSGENRVSVSGGGAPSAGGEQELTVGESQVSFGAESFSFAAEEEGGVADARAGSHPFQLTTAVTFDNDGEGGAAQPAQPRDVVVKTPPGLVGNATLMKQCTLTQFDAEVEDGAELCPAATAVGVATITLSAQYGGEIATDTVPIFNLVPGPGEPARFGFQVAKVPVLLDASVRTGGDYGITVTASKIPEQDALISSLVTFWGVPGDAAHDAQRGWPCIKQEAAACAASGEQAQVPFLTMPDSCQSPFAATMETNAWTQPQEYLSGESSFTEGLVGCNHIPFSPTVEAAPDVQSASSTSGLTVHVRLPQTISEDPDSLGESTIKNTTVALPAGVQLNPSDADGLEACSESQIGYLNKTGPHGELLFTGTLPEGWEEGRGGFCPEASKIGSVSIKTPLLGEPVSGAVYLASPAPNGEGAENPFNTLLSMYIVAEDKAAGVAVKLPGDVTLCKGAGEVIDGMTCGAEGQLISTFENTPQLPFEDLELHFYGGERSPLSTPAHCGSYTTQASFEPWSGGTFPASSTFEITTGPHGSACPGALPFSPSLTAGTTNNNAGGYSAFTMTMSREDGNQSLQAIQLKMPQGFSGVLSGVELCREPQADAGTCGPASQIGETIVSVGLGNEPYTVTGGKVYLTGPYNGSGECSTPGTNGCASFGLSIVNPANAGPFHLGNVIVRAKIEVNPQTAALTVTSDNSGPYKIPQFIDGIPLQIKHVNVTITRPGFTFNPTSCEPMHIEGSLASTEGASQSLSVPFQVTNCATLKFEPKFAVSTQGKTSKANGASLTVKLSEPTNALGAQANIHQVKVELPVQLPSRLTTLQKACTAAQFHANPAGCPAASVVGHAIVHTPILPVPLEGPAYFVSNGGEAFPNLIMVLQGYGVTVELIGDTFISKAGITSSTFKTVPDVPFSTFELNLPEESNSALAANANLCAPTKTVTVKKKVKVKTKHGGHKTVTRKVKKTETVSLTMPTEFIAQNGATIHQTTPVTVTECAKKTTTAKSGKKKPNNTKHKQRRKKKK